MNKAEIRKAGRKNSKREERGECREYCDNKDQYIRSLAYPEYVLFTKTCTVYSQADDCFVEMEPDSFVKLKQHFWNEDKAVRAETKKDSEVEIISADMPISEDGGNDTYYSIIADPNAPDPGREAVFSERREAVRDAFRLLDPVRQQVIYGLFYRYKTESEIADELGITQGNVHYHKVKALAMMKSILQEKDMEPEF